MQETLKIETTELSDDEIINVKNQKNECLQYNKICQIFDELSDNVFVKYYGGSYLDGDKLVVNVTSKELSIRKRIKSVTGNNNIIFRTVTNTYNELKKTYTYICDKLIKFKLSNNLIQQELFCSVTSVALSEKDNTIDVYLLDVSTEEIENFKKEIIDSDLIVFKKGEETQSSATTKMYMGNKIYDENNDSSYSIGCRATAIKKVMEKK